MGPNDIPALGGGLGADGGGHLPSASVSALESSAAADLSESSAALAEVLSAIESAALADIEESDRHSDASVWEYAQSAIDDIGRSGKGLTSLLDEIFSQASDDEAESHRAIESVGGRPFVMTDESWGANQAGSHFADAMDRIIMPAIDQQMRDGVSPAGIADSTTTGVATDDETAQGDVATATPPQPVRYGRPDLPPATPPAPVDDTTGEPPAGPPVGDSPPGGWGPADFAKGIGPIIGGTPAPPLPPPSGWPPGVPPTPYPPIVFYPPPTVPPAPPLPPYSPQPSGTVGGRPQSPPLFNPGWGPVPPINPPVVTPGSMDGDKYCEMVADCQGIVGGDGGERGIGSLLSNMAKFAGWQFFGQPAGGGSLSGMWDSLFSWIGDNSAALALQKGIADPKCVGTYLSSTAAMRFAQQWTGIDFGYTLEPSAQAMRYSSPVYLPSQGEVNSAYLSNAITIEDWRCYTRSNGNLPNIHHKVMMGNQVRIGINEAVQLRRRGEIDANEYLALLRLNGVLDLTVAERLYKLSEYIPSTTDIFQWVVKDVANVSYVDLAGLDEDFEESWNDTFQMWADANGVSKQQIQYEYRAQWKLPSRTQVDSFVHRLRPGRVDPALAFTTDQAREVYKLDDIPAGFRDRMLAVSYLPINRTDIQASYIAGSMPEAEVVERFQDLGYSLGDAKSLTEFTKTKAEQQIQGSMGAWTRRRITTEYVAGSIDRDEAEKLMGRTVKDKVRVADSLDDADTIRRALARKQCIKSFKKRYMNGEFDALGVRVELLNIGLNVGVARTLVEGWECELKSKHKEPTVKMLCDWVKNGLISVDDIYKRLINLGYSDIDARRIIALASIEDGEEKARKAKAAAKEAAAAKKAAAKGQK